MNHYARSTDPEIDRLNRAVRGMLASGRLCEMVGSKALDVDRFVRQLGLLPLALEDAQHLKVSDPGGVGKLDE